MFSDGTEQYDDEAGQMHFSNYISMRDAKAVKGKITVTPTALGQTPKKTIDYLKGRGIKIEVIRTKGRPRRLKEDDIRRIIAMRKSGDISFYKIANLTKLPKSTIFDYFCRYKDRKIDQEEINRYQIREAREIFRTLLKRDLDDGINELARKGYMSKDVGEMTEIMREIEDMFNPL